jgi:SAM-dependent methyltransferase
MSVVGSVYHVLKKNPISATLCRFLGTNDVHSHFRTRPLIEWAHKNKHRNLPLIVEVGCGSGANIFELVQIMPRAQFVGVDLDKEKISIANSVLSECGFDSAKFYSQDCSRFALERKPDVILLMDFLEHLVDPTSFLLDLRRFSKEDTILLVSVPTPRYPQVFGRRFHEKVGHVVDGYNEQSLAAMLEQSGFEILEVQYNTGLIASALCFIYYNLLFSLGGWRKILLGLLLSSFRRADVLISPESSCSIFAVARISRSFKSEPSAELDTVRGF